MSQAQQKEKGQVQPGKLEQTGSPSRRGRGRGRGRAANQGAARVLSDAPLPEMGELSSNSRPSTRRRVRETREVQEAPGAGISDGDTESVSEGMASSTSGSRRYPLRSSRTPLVVSTIYSDEVHEESGNRRTRKSERSNKTTSRQKKKGQKSQTPSLSGRLTEKRQPKRPTLRPSRPSASITAMATSHMNPLFLTMAHWINENPPTGGRSPHDEPRAVVWNESTESESTVEPHSDASSQSSENRGDDNFSRGSTSDINSSPFTVIPSKSRTLLRTKRPRPSSSSRMEPARKVLCAYPGQSIRNQAGYIGESEGLGTQAAMPLESTNREPSITSSILFPLEHLAIQGARPDDSTALSTVDSISESPEILDMQLSDTEATPRPPLRSLSSSPITYQNSHPETEQPEVAGNIDAIEAAEATTGLIGVPVANDVNMADKDAFGGSAEHAEDTMEVEVNARGTRLEREGFTGGVVPLMEYVHTELINDIVREHVAILGRDTEIRWENPPQSLNVLGGQYTLETFRNFQIPVCVAARFQTHTLSLHQTLLFSPDALSTLRSPLGAVTGHSPRPAQTYLRISTYFHLLGLRAATSVQTGQWNILDTPTSPCSLSMFTLQLATPQVPHNRYAREIFVENFIKATHAKLYSAQCITGTLFTKNKIAVAFDHALRVQIQLQLLSNENTAYQAIHRRERQEAAKIGKWLLLHQVVKMTEGHKVAGIVAEIGPHLCSSDESDFSGEEGDEMELERQPGTERTNRRTIKSWRAPAIMSFLDTLRAEGLYYTRSVPLSGQSLPSKLPPPDKTPRSWISGEYLDSLPQHG